MPLSPLRVIESGLCIGCGSCVGQSEAGSHMEFNGYGELRPKGVDLKPGGFSRTCPFSPDATNEDELALELFPDAVQYETVGRFRSAYVGFASEPGFRDRGSSGGMVSWILAELLRRGVVDGVAHVVPVLDRKQDEPFFRYRISRSEAEIAEGAKSRYYPIEMSEILREIARTPGRYALVGVPCFIKAVQLLRREQPVFRERIVFTAGLFCGHMKSALFVESMAAQMGVPVHEASAFEFRIKDETRPASTYTAQVTRRDGSTEKRDWWNLLEGDWGSGFFQSSACNFCDDVIAETADISFGDAWVEPYSSDGRGTNVVVVRSAIAGELISDGIAQGRLSLEPVDEAFIVATQEAGFRQRREGLAYRLTWPRRGVRLTKRVSPAKPESSRRRLIYRSRAFISYCGPRIFTHCQSFYPTWARASLAFYHGFAYSRGWLGRLSTKLGLK